MAKTLYKYEASSNKFVWFTTWDRALKNYYTDDYNYVPDPVVGNPYNTFVEFRSRKPGMANVDWGGDGVKEQFPMTKVQGQDDYRIIFRSLAIQHRKNPNTTWWFRKEDGSQYVPVDNHAYAAISVNPGVTYRVVVGDIGGDSIFGIYQAIAGKGGRGGYGVEGDGHDPSPGNPGQDGSYVFNNKYPDRYPYPMGAGGGSGAYTRGWDMGFLSGGKGGNHGGGDGAGVEDIEGVIINGKMEVMPLIIEVVEEEPLKLLVVGLRAVEEDRVIAVLLFYII